MIRDGLKDLKISVDVGFNRVISLEVCHGYYLILRCHHCQDENVPMTIDNSKFVADALHEFDKLETNFTVGLPIHQGINCVGYQLVRVL